MSDRTYASLLNAFQGLSLPEMQEALQGMQGIYEDRRRLADSLVSQLQALGVNVTEASDAPPPLPDAARLHAKYRSLKNPALTWAGRGRMALWLQEEMRESGLPLEAYLVMNQARAALKK
jgi:DNA-binding protein H-NS